MPPKIGIIVRICHILPVVIAIGGTIYMRTIVMPVAEELPKSQQHLLRMSLVRRFRMVMWVCIALIVLSGLAQLRFILREQLPITYQFVLAIKMILALSLFFIAIGLTLPGEVWSMVRRHAPLLLAINVALGTVIVMLSALLRQLR